MTIYVSGNELGVWDNPIGVVSSYNAWPNPGYNGADGNGLASLLVYQNIVKCPLYSGCQ